ncbi:hypothetical protein C922_05662 [Plasmodium inui San Antonio 1]|uniref:Uncharacterized protein n=1 Tax=Plasmodium inui San Antonio 1 TaxID=1237626 RepID=W7A4C6_9APIC|nr:hypothetical protein C922_05662 [Plasmodium inui San Antonio 1]EUD63959.1 hypothetical protein C922_05662 [Plasmodium inui San Antonio 1]
MGKSMTSGKQNKAITTLHRLQDHPNNRLTPLKNPPTGKITTEAQTDTGPLEKYQVLIISKVNHPRLKKRTPPKTSNQTKLLSVKPQGNQSSQKETSNSPWRCMSLMKKNLYPTLMPIQAYNIYGL